MISNVDYALMAGRAYQTTRDPSGINWFPIPQGWSPFFHVPDSTTPSFSATSGFEAISFQNGNNIVISYAGTDPDNLLGPDIAANIGLATGAGSVQLVQAVDYYLQVKALNPTATITFTGHSLGGGLAALMGVFFNQSAVTFDQAPFANSATTAMRDQLIADLLALKDANNQPLYTQQQLTGLAPEFMSPVFDPASRTGNVSTYRVDGEFTSIFPIGTLFNPIGTPTLLQHGPTDVAGTDLHSQALLTAFLQSNQSAASGTNPQQTLSQATTKLTSLLRLMFDNNLYAFPTSKADKNFIENLVRHEAGVRDPVTGAATIAADAMVTRFTSDLWKLAQDGGLTMPGNLADTLPDGTLLQPIRELLNKALIVFAMQKYYDENSGSVGVGEVLFKDVSGGGGIQFDFKAIAASWDKTKDAEKTSYLKSFLDSSLFTADERAFIKQQLSSLRDWYIQAGTTSTGSGQASGMLATDTLNRGAFMLGGTGADALVGGTGADLLAGNAGDDVLNGGQGSDILLGGIGVDTYVLNTGAGQGIDTVLDSDQKGYLRDDTSSPIVLAGGSQYGDNRVFRGKDANGTSHLYTFVTGDRTTGGDLMVDGAMLIKGYNPNTGNHMGISFTDATPYQAPQPIAQPQTPTPVMPTTTRDIIGDAQKAEFTNTLAAGTVIDPTWKWDILHVQENAHDENRTDANGNPYTVRIVDSHTYTYNQRDDLNNWILDPGQPDLTRADTLNGSSGNDHIVSGGGGDSINATQGGDDLIEVGDGNNSVNAGSGNDVIIGGINNDTLNAGAGDNTILAADGNNTLIAGKGNDTILTGKDVDTINAGEGNNTINAGDGLNTVTTGDGNDTLLTGKDNDIIHAGSGDNYVDAGAGRDIVDASATGLTPGVDPTQAKSILIGGADADILTGGAGEDKLYADSAIDTALAIAQGETQTGLTDQGDWLAGGAGDGRMRRRIRAANDAKHAIPPEWRIAA